MSLRLSGNLVPGHNPRVTVHEQIAKRDLSGDTSASASGHEGWKPAVITFTCEVPFTHGDWLTEIRRLWHFGETLTGEPLVWTVDAFVLTAMWITKAHFTDFLKVEPHDTQQLWQVTLTMLEVQSIPERIEQRTGVAAESATPAPEGTQTTGGEAPPAYDAAANFSDWVLKAEAWAGKTFFGGT